LRQVTRGRKTVSDFALQVICIDSFPRLLV